MQDFVVTAQPTTGHRSTWRARLDVEVLRTADGTRLGRRRHEGPLRIQRPFFPEGRDVLHLYLLHPPGGVVGGDELQTVIDVRPYAHAVMTTPAAQKLYRSSGSTSQIRSELRVESDGCLEWLPAETIVYDGAMCQAECHIDLAPSATFIGWEIVGLGRPASHSLFDSGRVSFGTELCIGGQLELKERVRIEGGSSILRASWGLNDCTCFGSLICASPKTKELRALEQQTSEVLEKLGGVHYGVTGFDRFVVLRAQGARINDVTGALTAVWKVARPLLLGQVAHEPRIWST